MIYWSHKFLSSLMYQVLGVATLAQVIILFYASRWMLLRR